MKTMKVEIIPVGTKVYNISKFVRDLLVDKNEYYEIDKVTITFTGILYDLKIPDSEITCMNKVPSKFICVIEDIDIAIQDLVDNRSTPIPAGGE